MNTSVKNNIARGETWVRALYMVVFAIICYVAAFVLAAVVVLQFLLTLFTGKANPRLLSFGEGLSGYVYQMLRFLTYNTEDKAFPFGPWPGTEEPSGQEEASDSKAPEAISDQSDKNQP